MKQFVGRKLTVLIVSSLILVGVSGCDRSRPSKSEITEYIESYQMVSRNTVKSLDYEIIPVKENEAGLIHVSGQLELSETLYEEDSINGSFRANVEKAMRRNRFSNKEIAHDIYDRVIRASTRVADTENQYYSFLKKTHDPGFAMNFSASLTYRKSGGDFLIDGKVSHARIKGEPLASFAYPVVDDTGIVLKAANNVIAERDKYQELMKQSKAVLRQLWDNRHGFVLLNRKVPYIGDGKLSALERQQVKQQADWHGIYHISLVKPIEFRQPRAAKFFQLGSYKTEGIATCLKPTGFRNDLVFAKAEAENFCEFGKQYSVSITLGSKLDAQNLFYTTAKFEINDTASGEYWHDATEFKYEDNRIGRYSEQQKLQLLEQAFALKQYARPSLIEKTKNDKAKTSLLVINYPAVNNKVAKVAKAAETSVAKTEAVEANVAEAKPQEAKQAVAVSSKPEIDKAGSETNQSKAEQPAKESKTTPALVPVKMTKPQLTKAVQVELQRLNIYRSSIDGIVGKATIWSINYFQNQRGIKATGAPSEELLTTLRATSVDSIKQPVVAKRRANKQTEKKGTVVGNLAKKTGRGIGKAANWVGSKFKKKDK